MSDMRGAAFLRGTGTTSVPETARSAAVAARRHAFGAPCTLGDLQEGGPLQTLLSARTSSWRCNDAFEEAHPQRDRRWALERSGLDRIAIASAFQAEGTVVMHLATQIRPDIPILFLETGFQFAETLAFKEQLAERLGLNVVDLVGEHTVAQQEAVTARASTSGIPSDAAR